MDGLDQETFGKLQALFKEGDSERPPSRKAIIDMLETLEVDEETRENLKAMLIGDVPKVFGSYGGGTLLAVLFILLVFAMLIFFGYKLFKSIKDKERKREDKKKAKQLKKKK